MRALNRPLSVRVSLTLWYVAATIVVLAVYAGTVFVIVRDTYSRQLDSELRGDFNWAAGMTEQKPDGTFAWFEDENRDIDLDSPWLQAWSPSGKIIYRTAAAGRTPIPAATELATHPDQRIVAVQLPGKTLRVLTGRTTIGNSDVILQVARSQTLMEYELRQLALWLALGLPLGVAAAGVSAYLLARRALAPVDRMADRARHISAERLSERLPVDNPDDEFGRLAAVFNQTLGRLESSFDQLRRFTADVSHELRTPLTAIRSVGEVGLRGHRDSAGYRGVIASMLEEVDRLACLVDRLLILSRAELGQAKLAPELIDLRELAEEVASHLGVLAEEKGQSLVVAAQGAPQAVIDRLMLRQSLINLVDNAIKYTPAGGSIRIRVADSAAAATIEVIDNGPGIRDELKSRIFERYYRAGDARSAELFGTGLGLSITKFSIEVNGGQLTVQSTEGGGSTFRIILPRARTTRPHEPRRRTA
jgi:heavy metal sensor kinase